MTANDFSIRPARDEDMTAVGRLGASLVRQHHAFDARRFMAADRDIESGYAWFLGTQLLESDVVILVAEREAEILGYLYAAIEPRSWKELREECGFIHDIVVAKHVRGRGIATALVTAAADWFRGREVPRIVLWSAEQNESAQRLFAHLGFRRTMVEMTLELSDG